MTTRPQIGSPLEGVPNIGTQLGQPNAPLVAFALAGGVTLAVGDVCMMFSVALLGLSVGPAAINALSIVVGAPLLGVASSLVGRGPPLCASQRLASMTVLLHYGIRDLRCRGQS